METNQSSFIREWLNYSSNGTSSNPTSIHSSHYLNGSMPLGTESSPQVPIGVSSSDVDHFYFSAASDRVYHPLPRRPLKDSPSFEKETLPQSPLSAGLAQCAGNSNTEGHKQKATQRNHLLPFGQEGGDEGKEWRHTDSSFSLSRFNVDSPVKHLVLSGSSKRAVESGEQKQGKSLGNSPTSISTPRPFLDRSFPFVGIHEKSLSLQSSLVDDVSSLNGRPSWQNSPKLDGNKTPQWGFGENRTSTPPPVASSLHGNGTGPKMAEALLQSSPRVKTPPLQAMAEIQRFEELTLMQSRQLIPITPSLPKTLSQGLSSREKSKSKVGGGGRSLDKHSQKTNLTKVPSQPLSSLSRSSLSTLAIEAGKFQAGMRAVQKANKEAGSGGGSPTTNPPPPSKLRPAVESKAPLDNGVVVILSKDGGTLLEEKRPPVHAQNRSDFFNMLRKKAALRRSLDDDSSVVGKPGEECMKSSDVEALAIATPTFVLEQGESPCSEEYSLDMKSLEIVEALEGGMDANEKLNNNSSVTAIAYSEEEAAFLKSLGWVEGSGEAEEEEGLTEEEINAFLEKHRAVMLSRGRRC